VEFLVGLVGGVFRMILGLVNVAFQGDGKLDAKKFIQSVISGLLTGTAVTFAFTVSFNIWDILGALGLSEVINKILNILGLGGYLSSAIKKVTSKTLEG